MFVINGVNAFEYLLKDTGLSKPACHEKLMECFAYSAGKSFEELKYRVATVAEAWGQSTQDVEIAFSEIIDVTPGHLEDTASGVVLRDGILLPS